MGDVKDREFWVCGSAECKFIRAFSVEVSPFGFLHGHPRLKRKRGGTVGRVGVAASPSRTKGRPYIMGAVVSHAL